MESNKQLGIISVLFQMSRLEPFYVKKLSNMLIELLLKLVERVLAERRETLPFATMTTALRPSDHEGLHGMSVSYFESGSSLRQEISNKARHSDVRAQPGSTPLSLASPSSDCA